MSEERIRIAEVRCLNCGAPAEFNIEKQEYVCGYCGGRVGIRDAALQIKGYRKIQSDRLKQSLPSYSLAIAACSSCGASVVFDENEALSSCAFCGQSLVREKYLHFEEFPENVIPFSLTLDEAKERMKAWCDANKNRREAKHLKKRIDEMQGYYLPYEMIKGPVHMTVSRMDSGFPYSCEGFMDHVFINRSKQLDNLLLDGMEPFDIESLNEFDFGYVAGHKVKIMDLPENILAKRISEETEATYRPFVRKTLETNAVEISGNAKDLMRIPVLLPVYFITHGETMAAVNGQSGKVSVRAEKPSHYYFAPWWLKAILATIAIILAVFAGMCLLGMKPNEALFICGLLAIVILVITLCLYSDTQRNKFIVDAGREIFTSGDKTFHRTPEGLVMDETILERKVAQPVYFETINGKSTPVTLKFTTPARVLKMVLLVLVMLFLPVILALLINGFDFEKLELGGSAVWFCIAVPVVPIYLLKFGIVELHERPLIYYKNENGRTVRYKKKLSSDQHLAKIILEALFRPPGCFVTWLCIAVFCFMVYLTAFGF